MVGTEYAHITHGISNYEIKLITLLVIDKFNEGIPVSFCSIQSEQKSPSLKFLVCIKDFFSAQMLL